MKPPSKDQALNHPLLIALKLQVEHLEALVRMSDEELLVYYREFSKNKEPQRKTPDPSDNP